MKEPQAKKRKFSERPRRERLALLVAGPVLIALVGGALYILSGRYAETDNAYVKANKVSISTEVTGRIAQIIVKDNTSVEQGQVLFTLDREPFEIALHQAEANLAAARADVFSLRADYQQKKAELAQAESNVRLQTKDYERYAEIVKSGATTVQRFDQARYARDAAIANLGAAKEAVESTRAKLGDNADAPIENIPRYKQAKAALDRATLDLARTEIRAPTSGIAASVDERPGQYVTAGVPLFSVVDEKNLWVEANFKETDLTNVRPGQRAIITIDTFPGHKWIAKVASITPATGAEFSILPPQNSSGNWVKIVQRIMVRLELEPQESMPQLAAGMSAEVTIDTRHSRLTRFFGAGD